MIRQRLLRGRLCPKGFSRSIVSTPDLPQFRNYNHVPQLLSRSAFELSWKHYQAMILAKLQKLVAGGPWDDKDPKDIALNFARDPANAALFNYASMAHNNHFFFQSISAEKTDISFMHKTLSEQLIRSFGSIKTLRLEMLKTANAMFGPGYVWLVKDFHNNYSILATYLAGSPYPRAHFRQQPANTNSITTENMPKGLSDELKSKYTGQAVNKVGAFGPHSKSPGLPPGAPESLTPVLCVNVWDHVYLPDYGLIPEANGGKPRYVMNWWDKIDWRIVSYRALGGKAEYVR